VRQRIRLVPVDLERAAKRPKETKIDQIISNALQDRRRLCRGVQIAAVSGPFARSISVRAYLGPVGPYRCGHANRQTFAVHHEWRMSIGVEVEETLFEVAQ